MLDFLEINTFDLTRSTGKNPVLLVYIHRRHDFKEQIDLLESFTTKINGKIIIYLLNESFVNEIKLLNIEGSPTFICFYKGKEKGRICGKVDNIRLETFITEIIRKIDKEATI